MESVLPKVILAREGMVPLSNGDLPIWAVKVKSEVVVPLPIFSCSPIHRWMDIPRASGCLACQTLL